MRFGQCVSDLDGDRQRFGDADLTAMKPRVERLPLDILHRDEEQAVGLGDFIDRADVRMVEGRGGPRFANEPRARVRVGRRLGGEQFERDVPAQLRIVGQVDFAHAACAEPRADLVATEPHAFTDELHCGTGRES